MHSLAPIVAIVGPVIAVAAIAGACTEAAPPATAAPTRSLLAARTELPLLERTHPFVQARLADVGPAVFLIDTAAQWTVIDERFAVEHGLALHPFAASAGPSAKPGRPIARAAHVPQLELGSARVTDLEVPVLDLAPMAHLAGAAGILGQDLLRTWFVALDGPGRRLVLLPLGDVDDAFAQLFAGRVGAVMFEPDWQLGIPLLKCRLAGAGDVDFVLDSGANLLCLPPAAIAALHLRRLRAEVVQTLDGDEERTVYELPRTALGALTIRGEVAAFERAVLGWSVLQGMVTVQDGRSGRVYVLDRPPWK